MEGKDWILLILPIIANGVIVFIYQRIITIKLDQINKKSNIRDEVVILFWKKLQDLNDVFIQANIAVKHNPEMLGIELEKIRNSVLAIVQYYDTNKYDLKIYSEKYKCWEESWCNFEETLKAFSNTDVTHQMQLKLGNDLQCVKDKTQDLIKIVRDKY